MLNTLNNLIIKYGQDLKNEQWVLEPFADMVISFSVMHLCFLRYDALNEKENKTLPILRCSLARHFEILISKNKVINNHIMTEIESNNENNIIDEKIKSFNWYIDSISLEQTIAEEFFKSGKYYID